MILGVRTQKTAYRQTVDPDGSQIGGGYGIPTTCETGATKMQARIVLGSVPYLFRYRERCSARSSTSPQAKAQPSVPHSAARRQASVLRRERRCIVMEPSIGAGQIKAQPVLVEEFIEQPLQSEQFPEHVRLACRGNDCAELIARM